MILYRIVRCDFADLSGTGSRLFGGRWNSEGKSMVYLASSRSLAVLEALAHLSPTNVPMDYCIMTVEAPESFVELKVSSLPENWHDFPEPKVLKSIGDHFILENKHLLLKVPSAIVQEEFNYLLNPSHKDAGKVKILNTQPFYFDARLKH